MSEVLTIDSAATTAVEKNTAQYDAEFIAFNNSINETVRNNLDKISLISPGNIYKNLFIVDTARNAVYEEYLKAFQQPLKQYNTCHCCKSYLHVFGSAVFLDKQGNIKSLLWDENNVFDDYKESVRNMRLLVESSPIKDRFYNRPSHMKFYCDTYKTGPFNHIRLDYEINLSLDPIVSKVNLTEVVKMLDASYTRYVGLKTGNEFVIDRALTLFNYDSSLKTRPSFKRKLQHFKDIVDTFKEMKQNGVNRNNSIYYLANILTPDIYNIKNTVLGELLDNLAKTNGNVEDEKYAIATFIVMTKSEVYMRPTEPPKVGNIDQAKKLFDELGFTSAFRRRFMTPEELNALPCNIWKKSPEKDKIKTETDILFENIPARALKEPTNVINGGRILMKDFLTDILPNALSVNIHFKNTKKIIVGSAQTAVDPNSLPIYRYDKMDNRMQYGTWITNTPQNIFQFGLDNFKYFEVTNVVPYLLDTASEPDENSCVFFVLKDIKYHESHSLCIFPEVLIPDLYKVRSSIEALSNAGSREGIENSFVGILIPKDNLNIVIGIDIIVKVDNLNIKYSF